MYKTAKKSSGIRFTIYLVSAIFVFSLTIQPAFADHAKAEVSISEGSGLSQDCEATQSCYQPFIVTIDVGGQVIWTNPDSQPHTVTAGNKELIKTDEVGYNYPGGNGFDSGLIEPGQTFSQKLNIEKTYDYFCTIHPWQRGVINIDDFYQVLNPSGAPTPTPVQPTTPTTTISSIVLDTDKRSYKAGNIVKIEVKLNGASSGQNVAIGVSDPTGNRVISRTITTDFRGTGEVEFKLAENSPTGTYQVIASSSVNDRSYQETSFFTVQSSKPQVSIVSVQPTDQQGNPVSAFPKEKVGFVKVVLSSDSSQASLVTVNLFDSDLTSLGIGSFKTTLSSGQSEMILSFYIPEDAISGTGDIYANVFSDWPSQGGFPLTGESASRVSIR